ncbi:CopD family protein [Acidisphaera sp. L21]|uniref:CopD family protein n=1 Tax=Acidisphaera sp. L21 TaxID=1641851 RepID=UPI00131AB23F|nr:CopD family protein [Acidisphaera sp. L21]
MGLGDVTSLIRALYVAGAIAAFGAPVASLTYARGAPGLRRYAVYGVAIAGAAGLVWLALQALMLADTPTWAAWQETLPTVALHTRFGQALLAGLILLVCSAFAHRVPATLLAGAPIALHAVATHATATQGGIGTAVEAIHLLAAAVWLGGLPALLLALRGDVAETARRFAWVGAPAVLMLAASGVVQLCWLAGGWAGLFGTTYGFILLAKIALFAAMLGLAICNRTLLATRAKWLARAIVLEAALGLLVVLLAAALAESLPGIHTDAVWPFPMRLTDAPLADPAARWGAVAGLVGSMLAIALLVRAVRHRRLIPLTLGVILATWSLPQLQLFTTEAYPTSFADAPLPTTAAIVAGDTLFVSNCVACHGRSGHGDGPLAPSLAVQPADLTAGHVLQHPDGDLFWFIAHGLAGPDGTQAMPGFTPALEEPQVWSLVAYVHALNVGTAFTANRHWPQPVLAPDFPITCRNRTTTLSSLRGRMVRLALALAPPSPSAALVLLPGTPGPDDACRTATGDVAQAYAALVGGQQEHEFLIDAQGWLRAYWSPANADAVAAKLRDVANAPPLQASVPAGHRH